MEKSKLLLIELDVCLLKINEIKTGKINNVE
jgi:hypothetical protein